MSTPRELRALRRDQQRLEREVMTDQPDAPASGSQGSAHFDMSAFTAALAPLAELAQALRDNPPAAAQPAVQAPAGAPILQTLPSNAIKVPQFKGTMPDPKRKDKTVEIRASPALVSSTLQRMTAFFNAYSHQYTSESLKLSSLMSCFPPGSPAAAWYESEEGMDSFESFEDFSEAFMEHFGPTEADKQRYDEQLLRFRQSEDESVVQYYTRFKNLCAELKAVDKPVQLHWQKTTFVNGLRDRIKREVSRVYIRDTSLTMEQLFTEAETEETVQRPMRPFFRQLQTKGKRSCFFCQSKEHEGKNCPKIAKKKANGTWKEKPPTGRGGAAQ